MTYGTEFPPSPVIAPNVPLLEPLVLSILLIQCSKPCAFSVLLAECPGLPVLTPNPTPRDKRESGRFELLTVQTRISKLVSTSGTTSPSFYSDLTLFPPKPLFSTYETLLNNLNTLNLGTLLF
jgi:hypothetical protein